MIANVNTGQPIYGNGTSYATPIMAAVTTCLWQAFPEVNNSSIIEALHKAADKSESPDDRTGYGIPDAKKAFVLLIKKLYNQQLSIDENCVAKFSWSVKTASDMNFVIERKLPSDNSYIPVGTQSTNTNFSQQNFIFSDDLISVTPGVSIQYRIKMNIAADTSFYLDSATINYTQLCKTDNIIIAPNPVTDNLTVAIKQPGQVNISITLHNISGQQVYKLSNQTVNGTQTFIIPMKPLSRGVYFVTIWIDNKKQVVKKVVRD